MSKCYVLLAVRESVLKEELERVGFSPSAVLELSAKTLLAHAELPTEQVSEATWVSRLAAVCPPGPDNVRVASEELRLDELWLATLLEANEAGSVKRFEAVLMPEIDIVVRRFEKDPDARDELRQLVRIKLLVGTPGIAAKIGQYAGHGRIAGWARTVAARVALNAKRGERQHDSPDILEALQLASTPEYRCLRAERQAEFWACLRAAFESLEPRARTVLRLRYRVGMTAAAIAHSYAVHESTMSRWLAGARETLILEFEERASSGLGPDLGPDELRRVLHSRLELSLQGLFSTVGASPGS